MGMNDIKTFEEFTDYRNVTGYGSMGQSGEQNAGPSFNKGPDSATYNRPNVIGVEQVSMEDPYFGSQRERKRNRVRKNKYVEKLRKDKSKYFKNLDQDTNKNKLHESTNFRYYKPIEKPLDIEEFFGIGGENTNGLTLDRIKPEICSNIRQKICDYLNEKYKSKIIQLESKAPDCSDGDMILLVNEFIDLPSTRSISDPYKTIFVSYDKSVRGRDNRLIKDVDKCYIDLLNDAICEVEEVEPKQIFSEEDPYGEEDWVD